MTTTAVNLPAEDKLPGRFIDAHSHIWAPDTRRHPLAQGLTAKDLDPPSFTDKELLKTCQPHGVNRVVLIQPSIYHRFDNSAIVDAIAANSGTFSGVAVIDHMANRLRETMLDLKSKGIRGFRIVPDDRHGDQGSLPRDKWLDSDGMRTMWTTAGENELAICPLIDPEYLGSVDTMCRSFPDTTVVVDHFARIGVDGRIRAEQVDDLCALAKHRNTNVKVSAFYALGRKQPPYKDLTPMIRRVLDAFGPQRLMWASDSPYQVVAPHTYEASINLIKHGVDGLAESDRDWLLQKTAERVYFQGI